MTLVTKIVSCAMVKKECTHTRPSLQVTSANHFNPWRFGFKDMHQMDGRLALDTTRRSFTDRPMSSAQLDGRGDVFIRATLGGIMARPTADDP